MLIELGAIPLKFFLEIPHENAYLHSGDLNKYGPHRPIGTGTIRKYSLVGAGRGGVTREGFWASQASSHPDLAYGDVELSAPSSIPYLSAPCQSSYDYNKGINSEKCKPAPVKPFPLKEMSWCHGVSS